MKIYNFPLCIAQAVTVAVFLGNISSATAQEITTRPNIIFFATDDLRTWINPLGYEQAKTPNLERLANKNTLTCTTGIRSSCPMCWRETGLTYLLT